MPAQRVMTFNEWAEKFRPITISNRMVVKDTIPVDYLPESDHKFIWSIIEAQGDKFLRSGYIDDAFGYFISKVPSESPTLVQYDFN